MYSLNYVFIFLIYIPRSGTAGLYGISDFSFLRNFHASFHSGRTNIHSDQHVQGFPFLHILANIYCGLFDDRHSDRNDVISYCAFDLRFPAD